jgi:hypothetical protein
MWDVLHKKPLKISKKLYINLVITTTKFNKIYKKKQYLHKKKKKKDIVMLKNLTKEN